MIKCMIVDDEPLARQLLESHVQRVNGLYLVKSCENAIEAFTTLQQKHIDLMFLDIQMPQITGIDLLRSLKDRPRVVLTTAYRGYAFDAYDLDVIDYLLKPISFERFLRGISKVYQLKHPVESYTDNDQTAPVKSFEDAYIYFREDREMVKVYLNDIMIPYPQDCLINWAVYYSSSTRPCSIAKRTWSAYSIRCKVILPM